MFDLPMGSLPPSRADCKPDLRPPAGLDPEPVAPDEAWFTRWHRDLARFHLAALELLAAQNGGAR